MKSLVNGQQQKRAGNEECPTQICISLGTAEILAAHRLPNPPWLIDPRALAASTLSSASAGAESAAGPSVASRLLEAGNKKDYAAAAKIITVTLATRIADIPRIPLVEADPSRPMYSYGVDSLVALEMRNWTTREIKANMALLDILSSVPVEKLATQIAQKSKLVIGT